MKKTAYVQSLSEDDFSLDCVIAVLKPSVTETISSATVLGLSNEFTVERIYSPTTADIATGKEVKSIYRIGLPSATESCAVEALATLESSPLVESCEVNSKLYLDAVVPNDALYAKQYSHALCSTDKAWIYSLGSSSVTVAVIDSGVKIDHPDLSANIWINAGEVPNDGIDNDRNGYIDDYYGWDFYNNDNDPSDVIGHGTHVAGIIGAVGNNSVGVSGVCWNVKIVPIKVLEINSIKPEERQAFLSNVINAIEYVSAENIPIINMSLGRYFESPGLEAAINNYFGLFFTSAGNEERNTDNYTRPSSLPCNNIIAVANTTAEDVLYADSNYGATTVDLAAPGDEILSTFSVYESEYNGYYYSTGGTSMAAPYVAGAAALIKSLNPHASTLDIKNAILQNVDIIPALEGKVLTGGRINVRKALSYFVTLGDIDQDGSVTVGDLMALRNHSSSPYLTGNALLAADVDENDVIDVGDIIKLQNMVMQSSRSI